MINKILIAFLSLVAATTVVGQNTVMVNNSNAVITYPLNFWSANAVQGRTGFGLGSAATNPASAFQPSSGVLSNLASSNAVNLTNLRASNVVGVLSLERGGTGATNALDARTALGLGTASTNPASAFQPSSATLSNLASSNAVNLTNLRATNIVGTIPASNISSLSLTNISGTLAISNGGSGAITAGEARTNFGLGASWLTNTVASNFRTAIGATTVGDSIFTATDAATARTNLGLGSTNDITNRTLVLPQADGLNQSTAYGVQWRNVFQPATSTTNGLIALGGTDDQGEPTFRISIGTMSGTTAEVALFNSSRVTFYEPLDFNNTTNAATTRTNLGLGWAALTNTSASGFGAALYGSNTNPVLVNTNGEVVSPTNFWQAAPISTTVQYQTNVTGTSTNAATNSRNLFLFSLAPSVSGLTNTVTLPTNAATTFEGDRATIIHLATNSANAVTAIRQLGAATNLITLNQADEAVLLMYRSGAWALSDNISYIEPIYFSGTNAAANAAASRTNLGLGTTNTVVFGNLVTGSTNSYVQSAFVNLLELRFLGGIQEEWDLQLTEASMFSTNNGINPFEFKFASGALFLDYENDNTIIEFKNDTNAVVLGGAYWNHGSVRTSLGLGATNNVTFSNITASGTLTATSTVTAKTNLIVQGHLDFTTNATNSNPATNNQIQDFIEIRVGTNQFWLPLYK